MAKPKKKLTAAQRAVKKQRKLDFMTVFMNGKQVRVRRPPTIEGTSVDDCIRQNADPIWLHQNGYYEILHEQAEAEEEYLIDPRPQLTRKPKDSDESDDLPF